MKRNYNISGVLAAVSIMSAIFFAVVSPAVAGESKYATATNTAAVTFGADPTSQQEVTAILAKSDKATAAVKLYARGGAGKALINVASTSGAQVVYFANASLAFNTNDLVVYQHGDGTLLATTVASGVTTGGVTLATGLTRAGSTVDRIYEVTQQGQLDIGTTALNVAGYVVFVGPADSPIYATADGNTNVTLTVTKQP